jgi:Flp pilus assembly protein TadD
MGGPFPTLHGGSHMSKTLNLAESLLAMGRELQSQGRKRDARLLFCRLVKFRDLPTAIAEEIHARLSDLFVAEKQFKRARRHLSILMCLRPHNGRYYHQYALACHRDPRGDKHRAAKFYQQALDLDPTRSRWWSNYGKLLTSLGRTADGVAALRQAFSLDEDNPVIVGRLAEALCLDDRADEARSLLRAARFRHPRDGRFLKLWNDLQHRIAAHQFEAAADDPVFLPFVRRSRLTVNPPAPDTILRMDEAQTAPAKPHRLGRVIRRDA